MHRHSALIFAETASDGAALADDAIGQLEAEISRDIRPNRQFLNRMYEVANSYIYPQKQFLKMWIFDSEIASRGIRQPQNWDITHLQKPIMASLEPTTCSMLLMLAPSLDSGKSSKYAGFQTLLFGWCSTGKNHSLYGREWKMVDIKLMGNKHSDINVEIAVELDKPFYYAGEVIQGQVHLIAKQNLPYTALILHYENKEHCRWSETYGKTSVTYDGKKNNFADEFVLRKFDQGIPLGQYVFPFSFSVPMGLPGSYSGSTNCKTVKIYYPVKAFLIDYRNPAVKPEFQICATVVEKPRSENRPNIRLRNTGNPKTCCCIEQGPSSIDVTYDTSAVRSGQPIRLSINVDNRQCKQDIKGVEVTMVQNEFVQSELGAKRHWKKDLYRQTTASVGAGQQGTVFSELDTTAVEHSTALGSIVGNWYTVRAEGIVAGCICCPCCTCCCGNDYPVVEKEVYIDASPVIPYGAVRFQPPNNWAPAISNRMAYQSSSMDAFIPNPTFPFGDRTSVPLSHQAIEMG